MMSDAAAPLDVRPATGLLKALADDNRLRIVALLSRGELCVCHIASGLDLSQPNVSQHLNVLKTRGWWRANVAEAGCTTGSCRSRTRCAAASSGR